MRDQYAGSLVGHAGVGLAPGVVHDVTFTVIRVSDVRVASCS